MDLWFTVTPSSYHGTTAVILQLYAVYGTAYSPKFIVSRLLLLLLLLQVWPGHHDALQTHI
jgi:hypothetical protein